MTRSPADIVASCVLAALAGVGILAGPAAAAGEPVCSARLPAAPTADPAEVEMTPSGRAPGLAGTFRLRLASSPTGVGVTADGSYRYDLQVSVEGLRPRESVHYVAWVATPELDRHVRLGTLGEDGRVTGQVSWNKFLVFVTAESRPDPEAWSQRILLSATSPSGRMHTMAGHGPFSGEPCLDPRS